MQTQALKLRLLLFTTVTAASASIGCSESNSDSPDPGSATPLCSRDPALVAAASRCIDDGDCPCGAYCSQGICDSDCLDDSDCEGGASCSAFGRCGEGPLGLVAADRFSVRPTALVGVDEDQPGRFWIVARTADLGRVDVRAEAGVEVACEGGTFANSCFFEALPAGTEASVEVRGRVAVGGSALVRVRAGPWSESVTVAGPSVSDTTPTPGRYRGTVRLVAAGGADAPRPLPETSATLLEADVYGGVEDSFIVRLRDPLGAVLPRESWVGEVVSDRDGSWISFPSLLLDTISVAADVSSDVLAEFERVPFTIAPRTLSFPLVLRFRGTPVPIGAEYQVTLNRIGDLTEEAPPAVPPSETLPRDPAIVASTPSAWEVAFASVRDRYSIVRLDLQRRGLEAYQGLPRLDACGLSDDEKHAVALRGTLEAMNGEDGTRTADTISSIPGIIARNEYFNEAALRASSNFIFAAIGENIFPSEQFTASLNLQEMQGFDPENRDAIYCAFEHDEETLPVNFPAQPITIPANSIDRCADVATRYGCTVEDLDERRRLITRLSLSGFIRNSGGSFFNYQQPGLTPRFYATRVCRLPPEPPSCGNGFACYAYGSGDSSPEGLSTVLLDDQIATASGDLLCEGIDQSLAAPLYDQELLDIDSPGRLDRATMFDACRIELESFRAASAPTGLADNAVGLDQLLSDAECVDPARIILNLGIVPAESATPLEQAILHRRAQQWVRVHGFLARNAAERERFAPIIRAEDTGTPPIEASAILDSSLNGWSLLLHPRFGGRVRALSPVVLSAPDYRPRAVPDFASGLADHPQPVGIAVDILDTLSAQLQLATRARRQDAGAETDLVTRRLLGLVPLVTGLANDLVARAASIGDPDWLERFRGSEQAMAAALSDLLKTIEQVREGQNPLGIEDEDLPLYFFGDQVGAGGRFLAISDYLLGEGPESSAWAPALVRQAASTLEAARQAWLDREQRKLLAGLEVNDRERREEEVRLRYGNAIADLCGPISGLSNREILDPETTIDPDVCFLNLADPACTLSTDELLVRMTPEMVAREVCLIGRLKEQTGGSVAYLDPALDAMAQQYQSCSEPELVVRACASGRGPGCYTCGALSAPVAPDSFRQVRLEGVDPELIEQARQQCGQRWWRAPPLPTFDALRPGAADNPSCYRGSLGELSLTVRSTAQQVERARSRLRDQSDAYDIAMRSCFTRYFGDQRLIQAQAEHDEVMSELRRAKLRADRRAVEAAAVKDCATAYGGDWTYGGASGVACYAASVEGRAQIESLDLQFVMDEVQQRHDAHMARLEAEVDRAVCFNDAEMHLVGARTAAIELAQARTDLQRVLVQFENAKSAVSTHLAEGRSVLQLVEEQRVPHPVHDFWLDERLQEFERQMRLAQRTVFLASRAVEYELQASLQVRDEILGAVVPAQLDRALSELRLTAGTRRISGRAPSNLKATVSLKDELLQLEDRSDWPETFYRFTQTERLRRLLSSPRFAVHDEDGEYLGQRIPFSLAPLGTLGLGDARGISLLTGGDCAERLWSVNAIIQGSEEVVAGGSTTVRIDLLKSNEFFSQWCIDRLDGQPYQRASVRPSRNLFREPGLGAEVGTQLGLQNPNLDESRGRIQARVNIPRSELESDGFTDGSTTELAARGLYGSYALFIPADVLKDPADPDGRGLDLSEVDDILLRFDYVSVAR